jgi:predicted Zn finger-like uncharacterized protein
MKITCDSCGAKYTIADDKVRGRKVKIRCKGCGTPIVVDGAQQSGGSAPGADEGVQDADGSVPIDVAAGSIAPSAGEWSVNLSETDQRTMSTQQLVQGWANGTVTSDAFVWKEGMSDWLPILECAELSQLLAAPPPQPEAASAAVSAASTRPASSAARVTGGRGQVGTDLFAGVDQAGGVDYEDVNTSAPALPNVSGRASAEDARPTGQRNENSVLFSLDALKAGFSGGAAPAASPAGNSPAAPKKGAARGATAPADDPFGLGSAGVAGLGGGGPMFSLADNNALLTAPAPPEPPKPVISFASDPSSPTAAPSSKKGLVMGLLAVLIVGGAGGAYALSAKKEKEEALAAAAAAAASAEKAHEEERKAKAAEERAREEQKAQEAKAAAATAAAAAASKPEEKPAGSAEPPKPGVPGAAGTKPLAKKDDKKDEKKDAPAPAAGGDQPFSKAAAVAALGAAAGGAGGCKKLGGPTGPGKVTVTFANSGRVTTANVQGPPYAGTSVGGCVASIFRKAKVPAFSGSPVTVSKGFSIN